MANSLFSGIYRSIRPAIMFGRHAAAVEEKRRLIEIITNTVCENQGKLAEYAFIAAEKHKEIRKAIDETPVDINRLTQLVDGLDAYVYSEFSSACDINFKCIHKYFEGRSHHPPRICVKMSQGDNIVDPNIKDASLYITPKHHVSGNTGFQQVDQTGKKYICNDIPTRSKLGHYSNIRLIDHLTRSYKPPFLCNIRSKLFKDYIDNEWCNCWTSMSHNGQDPVPPPTESCYKSTLIIPLTLLGNRLSSEFKTKFNIMQFHEKAIFGFLCIDHQHVGYFEDEDANAGFIFADLLSLYLIHQMVYTSKSNTYGRALRLIGRA